MTIMFITLSRLGGFNELQSLVSLASYGQDPYTATRSGLVDDAARVTRKHGRRRLLGRMFRFQLLITDCN